ncbi:MAG TPA: hypothetical protein DDW89_06420 [Gammaproteobacteria bacterium]|nr:hypothetical protein [Gammaproteobacteria bacterium]
MLKRCLILLCLLALTACATDPFAKSPAAGSGALAGQLTGDATRPYAVLILPAGQGFAMAWTSDKAYPDEDGDFLLPDLAPGQYVLAGFSDGQRPYWFNRKTGAARCVTVRAGEVAFLGSYRLIEGKSPEITERFYGLEWTEDRSAADVLGRLRTKTGDPAWAAMIGKTLSALPDPAPSRPTPDCSQAR